MKRFMTLLLALTLAFSIAVPSFAVKTYFDFPSKPLDKNFRSTFITIQIPGLGYFDLDAMDPCANYFDKAIMYYSKKYNVEYQVLDFIVLFSTEKDVSFKPRMDNSERKEIGISGMTQKEFQAFVTKTYKIKKYDKRWERDLLLNIEARAYMLSKIEQKAYDEEVEEPVIAMINSLQLDQSDFEDTIEIKYLFDQYLHTFGSGIYGCINDFAFMGDTDEGYNIGCYDLYDEAIDGVGYIESSIIII